MKITNNTNLPQVFVDIAQEDYTYKKGEYSVTELLKGIREIRLTREHYHEIEVDVSNMSNLIFGNAVHHLLELKDTHNVTEKKLKVKVGDKWLKGRFDAYDSETYTLIDYKTASSYKIKKGMFEDWRKQGLMYAWLCKQNGIYVDKVQFIVMIKDWKARDEISPIYVYEFKVLTLDLREIEEWIKARFLLLDTDTPCTETERWTTPTKYAVMKNGGKRALKVYNNKEDCVGGDYIETRLGTDKKCESYCDVKQWCKYYKGGMETQHPTEISLKEAKKKLNENISFKEEKK